MCRSYIKQIQCHEVQLAHNFVLLFAVEDGNYDYALLPGFPGDEISCGDRSFNLPSVPQRNHDDTSYDLSKEDAGDFGIGDFSIEMNVTGKGWPIADTSRTYGALFMRGEAESPDNGSGPSVYIFSNGNMIFRVRSDESFTFENALPNPKEIITRHLVFSRTGMTLQATIDGTQYTRTITKGIDDIASLKRAPLRFRGNFGDKTVQSLYMDVTGIIMSPPAIKTLGSLENKALAKSAMSSCDLSMSLLLGSTISLGTLTVITSFVSAKGTEHMPGNCCMDSPTNSDFFGYRVSIMIAASISVVVP